MKNIFVRRIISIIFCLIYIYLEVIRDDLFLTKAQYFFGLILVIGVIYLARILTKLDFRIIYGIPVILIIFILIISFTTYWLELLSKEQIKYYFPWIRTIIDGGIISYTNDRAVIEYDLTNKDRGN